jgi:hypothetical protein
MIVKFGNEIMINLAVSLLVTSVSVLPGFF